MYAQNTPLTVTGTTRTGRFAACPQGGSANTTVTHIGSLSTGTTVSGGTLVCNDPCGTTTLEVTIDGIRWDQVPDAEWLHGLFFPANNGFSVTGISIPAGFITYNAGCTGQCPGGIAAGPGFYYNATFAQSCCPSSTALNGIPCDNYGSVALDCNSPFSITFNLTFCNSTLTTTTETFTVFGTSDGATGCWSQYNPGTNTLPFTINISPCTVINPPAPTAGPIVRSCVGGVENFTVQLSSACGTAANTTWWTDSVGGTQLGSGSPFTYDPAGATCPGGQTVYMSCCSNGGVNCITRKAITIPGTCTPFVLTGVTKTNGLCTGNGSINSVTTTGGVPTFNYSLNPGGLSNGTGVFTGLTASSYTVSVTDGSGCIVSSIVPITNYVQATFANPARTHVQCFGQTNGSIIAAMSTGTGPYTYSIAPVAGTQAGGVFSNLPANTYTLSVSDANGCTSTTSVTITQPTSALTATMGAPTHVTCFGLNNGSATVTAAGGTTAYTYAWTGGGGTAATTSSRPPGTYTVTVTDAKGCTSTSSVTITGPASALALSASSVMNVSCFGAANGSITTTTTGGTPAYTYTWTPGGQTTANISGVGPGTYNLTVSDSKGCTSTISVNITQPSPGLSASITTTHVTCFGAANGIATASAAGGTSPYGYIWSPSGGTAATTTPLAPGSFTVTVTDANGCTTTSSTTITQPTAALTATMGTPTHINCFGQSTGSATVTAAGGTPAYTYAWSGGGGTAATTSGRPAGTYTVTITDSRGCTSTSSVTITQPAAALTATIGTPTHINCFGQSTGSATVTAAGGTTAYTYSWSGGGGTAATTTGRPAGTYTVTVTDSKGCTATSSVTITQPAAALTATIGTPTHINCFGQSTGAATVTAAGGTSAYTYSWSGGGGTSATTSGRPAGTYTVTVTDSKGCTSTSSVTITQPAAALSATMGTPTHINCFGQSTGAATVTAAGGTTAYTYAWSGGGGTAATTTGRPAGTYTVTVTDSKGCTSTSSVTITQPAAALTATMGTPTHINCFGQSTGSAMVTAAGGTPAYTYSWSGGGGTAATTTGRPAGTYTVTVTDSKGCTTTSSVTITQPAAALTATIGAPTHINCFGQTTGAATVTAAGGTSAYSYAWTGGGGTAATASNLAAGTYSVTITDSKGCTSTSSVTITQPAAALTATMGSPTHINCFGQSTGAATVTAAGGTPAYTYSWSGGGGTSATTSSRPAGTYTVTVTDSKGCTTTASVTITQPAAALTATMGTPTHINCFGQSTGTATVTAAGGTPTYTYLWTGGGGTSASTTGRPAGTYT
ncbi:MAG: hypothetical protein RL660_2915, partial [Bacteroidota bacterium]